jgi:hypothetical protein
MNFKAIEAGEHGAVIVPKAAGLGFDFHFQDSQAECAAGREDRIVREDLAGGKMFGSAFAVKLHQRGFIGGDVGGEGRARRNQFEKVMLLCHDSGLYFGRVDRVFNEAGESHEEELRATIPKWICTRMVFHPGVAMAILLSLQLQWLLPSYTRIHWSANPVFHILAGQGK